MDLNLDKAPTSIQTDPESLSEIDELFGSSEEDVTSQGPTPVEGDLTGTSGEDSSGDNEYVGLNVEQLARKLQSNLDKTKHELTKATEKLSEREGLEHFIHSLYEDPEVRHAFIAEIEPDLAKPKDPYEAVAQQLKKEFGDDFIPDDDEAKKPLTTSWRYHRRVDDLLKKVEGNQNKVPKSLKELREARKTQLEASQTELLKQKKDIITKMKWDDTTWSRFEEWGKKFNLANLATVYNYTLSKGKAAKPQNLAYMSGNSKGSASGSMAELNKYFG